MARVLVTGGAGFIGSHLVGHLLGDGHEVTVLDLLTTGRIANLSEAITRIRFVRGSILDETLVDQLVGAHDVVFHLAAVVGVRHIMTDPHRSMRTNVRGTENVLAACHKYWRRVLLASSSEVYGRTPKLPMHEDDDRVLGPTVTSRWSYAVAKALDEHLAFALARDGLPVSVVRYFNTYGPQMDPQGYGSVVANFMRQALTGEPMTVHGDGLQSRSFTYVSDTVLGTIAAGFSDRALGTVINLGSSAETTIVHLAETIRTQLASSSEIQFVSPERYYGPGFDEARRRVPDTSRAMSLLGWEPRVSLADGLSATFDWWKSSVH